MSKKKIKINQINSEIFYENEVSCLKILKIIIPSQYMIFKEY